MKNTNVILGVLLVLALVPCVNGCARAARNTEGFAMVDGVVIDAPFTETWQAAKSVLRESKYDIYTRDKRGLFVAYPGTTHKRFVHHRTQYTITLEAVSAKSTRVTVETLKQVYGVTLMTYPGWHDRKTTDNSQTLALLEAVKAKVAGQTAAAS